MPYGLPCIADALTTLLPIPWDGKYTNVGVIDSQSLSYLVLAIVVDLI